MEEKDLCPLGSAFSVSVSLWQVRWQLEKQRRDHVLPLCVGGRDHATCKSGGGGWDRSVAGPCSVPCLSHGREGERGKIKKEEKGREGERKKCDDDSKGFWPL